MSKVQKIPLTVGGCKAERAYAPKEANNDFLTKIELETIRNCELPTPTLDYTRHAFLFQCLTGLRYHDLVRVEVNNLIEDANTGLKYISIDRQKTEKKTIIPLTQDASCIIERFKDHPVRIKNGVLIPVVTYPKYNFYLKQLANLIGSKKRLTTHCARRTAVTYFFGKGVSKQSISAMLGYNVTTDRLYPILLHERVINEFLHCNIALRKVE